MESSCASLNIWIDGILGEKSPDDAAQPAGTCDVEGCGAGGVASVVAGLSRLTSYSGLFITRNRTCSNHNEESLLMR